MKVKLLLAVAADDLLRSLEVALRYYRFAEKSAKEHQVRDKALKLATMYERKGEREIAADYYRLAGANDQRAAAESKQAEDSRRKKFDQDQKALEKDIGL